MRQEQRRLGQHRKSGEENVMKAIDILRNAESRVEHGEWDGYAILDRAKRHIRNPQDAIRMRAKFGSSVANASEMSPIPAAMRDFGLTREQYQAGRVAAGEASSWLDRDYAEYRAANQ